MRKPWYKSNPELFAKTKRETETNYPELRLVVENDTVFLRGSFTIEGDGETLDRYLIEIQFPEDYADSIRSFLSGPVRKFFIGQSLVEQGKPWAFGERDHGIKGLYQAYGELIGNSDPESIGSPRQRSDKKALGLSLWKWKASS